MSPLENPLLALRQINELAAFNRWGGIVVDAAEPGQVEISLSWKPELGQYSGFLHAGVIGGLIDTACGYAAATLLGPNLLASHYSVNCLRPAIGERFCARAKVIKPGRTQIFTACELHAIVDGKETLVATGETLLSVLSPGTEKR